LIKTLRMKL